MANLEIIITMLQGLFIFAVVVGLTWWFAKKAGKQIGQGRCSRYMESRDRLMVGQDKYLEIVKIGEKNLLLGITPSGISLLAQLEDKDLSEPEKQQPEQKSFAALLGKLAEKKDRLP